MGGEEEVVELKGAGEGEKFELNLVKKNQRVILEK